MAPANRALFSAPGTATLSGIRAGRSANLQMGFTDVGEPRTTYMVVGRTASTDPPSSYVQMLDREGEPMTDADSFSSKVNGSGNFDGSLTWVLGMIPGGWSAGVKVYVALFDGLVPADGDAPIAVSPAVVVQA